MVGCTLLGWLGWPGGVDDFEYNRDFFSICEGDHVDARDVGFISKSGSELGDWLIPL